MTEKFKIPPCASQTLMSCKTCQPTKLFLRIPRQLWNSYDPLTLPNTSSSHKISKHPTPPKKAQLLKLKPKYLITPTPALSTLNNVGNHPHPRPRPTNCKTPLYSFKTGGCRGAIGGKHRNEIELQQPCLRAECTTCRTWNPKLIDDPVPRPIPTSTPAFGKVKGSEVEPLAFNFKLRELMESENRVSLSEFRVPRCETTCGTPTESRDMLSGCSDSTTLPCTSANPHTHTKTHTTTPDDTIFLPTHLVRRATAAPASARTMWRSTPRKSYRARLKFRTMEGRRKVCELDQRVRRCGSGRGEIGRRGDGDGETG